MVEESLRQQVFYFMDNNPEAKPKEVYIKFPKKSESSLRTYRTQFLEAKLKSMSRVKIANKNNMSPGMSPEKIQNKNESSISRTSLINAEHFFSLLNTFPHIPLFIYNKICSRAKDRFGNDYDKWIFSYYEWSNEIIVDIANGLLDNEIMDYTSDTLQNFGNIYCQEYWGCNLIQEELEAKDETGSFQEYYEKAYNEVITIMANIEANMVLNLMDFSTPNIKAFKTMRSRILWDVFFNISTYGHTCLSFRPSIAMKEDLKKLVMEYNLYNNDKKDFIERVKEYNSFAISRYSDNMTVSIEKDLYIDLGKHGEEYLGLYNYNAYNKETERWDIPREDYYDKVEFV